MKKNLLMLSGDSGIARGKRNVFFEMLQEFSKYFENIDIITGGNAVGKSFTIHGNVHIHPNNFSEFLRRDFWMHSKFAYKKALEINGDRRIDLLISHVIPPFFPGTKAGMKIAAKLKIPHFAEVMHIPGYPKAEGVREVLDKVRMRQFMKSHYKKFSRVRIINENEPREFLFAAGLPKTKLIYIPAFYLDFDTFKKNSRIKKNREQFVYSGRFETNKNIFAMLDAVKNLRGDFPKLKLKMVGDGTLFEKVKKYIVKNGMEQHVEILGWLRTQKDLAKIYNESIALIMPSFSEGGPRVTLEAMACGTVVVSTPVGIMPNVIKDGKNGFIIGWESADITNKMRDILLSDELRLEKIAHEGQKSVQKFEYTKAIKNYAETYLSMI